MTQTVLVIARARTGSTVLRQCLGSAENAFDLGEVFHAATYLETNFWRFWHELSKSAIRLAHPQYLPETWQKFLAQKRGMTGAEAMIVDTKVEYLPIIRTPQAGHYWPIFPVAQASDNTKIIRLYRKNVLAQIISLNLANRSNVDSTQSRGTLRTNRKAQ
jgi:LPS sulfotransferase NodH